MDLEHDVSKHMGPYYAVFVALLCLTAITVGVSYLKLNRPLAITVALIIATIKAGLVAAVFMHLSHEKKLIYGALLLTLAFFIVLMSVPFFTVSDSIGTPVQAPAASAHAPEHTGR